MKFISVLNKKTKGTPSRTKRIGVHPIGKGGLWKRDLQEFVRFLETLEHWRIRQFSRDSRAFRDFRIPERKDTFRIDPFVPFPKKKKKKIPPCRKFLN